MVDTPFPLDVPLPLGRGATRRAIVPQNKKMRSTIFGIIPLRNVGLDDRRELRERVVY